LDNLEKYCRTGQTTDDIYDAGALHVGNLRLHNTLLFHCNNGHINTPQCYIICTLPVLCFYAWRNKHSGIKCETRTYARLERRKTKVTGIIKDNASESYA
jgi:hypothetical protein